MMRLSRFAILGYFGSMARLGVLGYLLRMARLRFLGYLSILARFALGYLYFMARLVYWHPAPKTVFSYCLAGLPVFDG